MISIVAEYLSSAAMWSELMTLSCGLADVVMWPQARALFSTELQLFKDITFHLKAHMFPHITLSQKNTAAISLFQACV